MKYQITAAQFAGLSEDAQKLYGSEKDDKHTLKIEGLPDFDEQATRIERMDAKITELLDEKKKAVRKTADAVKEAERLAAEKATKDGDVDAINASWQKKLDKSETATKSALAMLHTNMMTAEAMSLAAGLAIPKSAGVLLPHIEPRMGVEVRDGKPVIVVKGKDGKPSAMSIKELGEEIANDAQFAPVIAASDASGGGAAGSTEGGGAATKSATRAEFASWSPEQQSKFSTDGGTLTE